MDSSSIHSDLLILQNQISELNANLSRIFEVTDILGDIECGSNRMLHYLIQILVHQYDLSDLQQQLILQKKLSVDGCDGGCPCE